MNCRVIYALVPTEPLEAIVRKQATVKAQQELEHVAHSIALENQSTDDDSYQQLINERAQEIIRSRRLWK